MPTAAPRTDAEAVHAAQLVAYRAALRAARGNVSAAAIALGVSLATCKRRIAALDLGTWLRETYPISRVQRERRAREKKLSKEG